MKTQKRLGLAAIVVLGVTTFLGYRNWDVQKSSARVDVLAVMPAEASAILFADFGELRQAPFLSQLYAWAPKAQLEADYTRFVEETGFDYEKDLDRIGIAIFKNSIHNTSLAVVGGRFDQKRISEYALKHGKSYITENNRTVFVMSSSDSSQNLIFMFLRKDLLVITNDALGSEKLHDVLHLDAGRTNWHKRFERLAGSPVFAVIRQDAALGAALAAQAPGGLRSPQLSSLLDQLQWITIAGKPESDHLRLIVEGECTADTTARQLADVLNGVVILAEGGLNDPKTRKQLDPALRQAYLELLRNADVSKIDRGDTKSVRLVLDITPGFLEATRNAQPLPADTPLAKPPRKDSGNKKKGHT